MIIRWMIREDIPEVVSIETECYQFPWTERDFAYCLNQRPIIGMVAEHERRVVGYMIYEVGRNDMRVLNIAVHPGFRRQLVGTSFLNKLKKKLTQQKRRTITADVRESNYVAHKWLKSCEFICVETLRQCYAETDELGYRFKFDISPPIAQILKNRISEVSR